MMMPSSDQAKQELVIYPLQELQQMKEQGRLELREARKLQVRAIRKYIIDNIMTGDVYFPPLAATGDLSEQKPSTLQIIDGVNILHALLTLEEVIQRHIKSTDAIKKRHAFRLFEHYPTIEVVIQVFDKLDEATRNRLYIEMNSHGKKVSLSKKIQFDSRDMVNVAVNDLLANHKGLQLAGIDHEHTAIIRPKNTQFLSLSQLRKLVSIFITGKLATTKTFNLNVEQALLDERLPLVNLWFDELFKLQKPEFVGDCQKSMMASYILMQALAMYTTEGLVSSSQKTQHIQRKWSKIAHIDWTPANEVWQRFDGEKRRNEDFYYFNNAPSTVYQIVDWLKIQGGESDVNVQKVEKA